MSDEKSASDEYSPSHYIERVSLESGELLDDEIRPEQLLVNNHRDYHLVDVHAHYMMGRVMKATGDEEWAYEKMKRMRRLGHRTSEKIARAIGQKDPEKVSKALFGLKKREYYFRYKRHPHTKEEIAATVAHLQEEAAEKLAAVTTDGKPAIRVLLTGGTGFVGKEFLWQAAQDDAIAELIVLIRPKEIRDRKTKEVVKVLSPSDRGANLLRQLWLEGTDAAAKFRFIAGDVEQPRLGISDEDLPELERTVTHVIHCAASVAFDDPYPVSFDANVKGTLSALRFSRHLQNAEGSPFVAHVSIETSYIHGRHIRSQAREDEIVFPRKFYNNYYELTKAMASIETERFMLDEGLRVAQLCPAIVIGEARAGNNRGDTKVVNAPVNLFGRAAAATENGATGFERSKVSALARLACIFPADPSAEINLIPVDRVAAGMVAVVKRPQAVGERVHLATDNRLKSERLRDIVNEEIGAKVTLAEPTIHRTVTLPLLTGVLRRLKQPKVAYAMEKLGTIFAGYSEFGQPIHEVGNDVRILGLSEDRPVSEHIFRMLCRHNRYVQQYGKVREDDEISRREKIWWDFCLELEEETGGPVGAMSAEAFREVVQERLDLETFERKT
jgi:nucleoside-diphosphate-sugar epimerase